MPELLLSLFADRSNPVPFTGQSVNGKIYVFVSGTEISQVSFYLDDPDRISPPRQVVNLSPYDFALTAANGQANPFDTKTIANGSHTITAVISLSGGETQVINGIFTVNQQQESCSFISPLACTQVRVTGAYNLNFDGSGGGIKDKNGVGTGFTMIDPPTKPGNPNPNPDVPGYWAEKLQVDTTNKKLKITTTSGLNVRDVNSLDNALGVGLNLPSQTIEIKTTLSALVAAPGGFAQAGLWFGQATGSGRGTSQDNYIKLVVISPKVGVYQVEALLEKQGVVVSNKTANLAANTSSVTLSLLLNPQTQTVTAQYQIGNNKQTLFTFTNVPPEWFSFDQAGIEPNVKTRSFGGIFASHRNAPNPIIFTFDSFSVTEQANVVVGSNFNFGRWSFPVNQPTAMVLGQDGRLYVTELLGTIHAFRLNYETQTVIDEQIIDTIRTSQGNVPRLTLGIDTDPASTPDNVILWVAHSDGKILPNGTFDGAVNSGIVSRLSGTGFATIENVITGLPRAIANHATNSIHFGPDGKLYLAQGGNTGAGAPNTAPSEFGDRPEQPLSAALLVADVNAPGFQGSCATPIGQFGIPETCNVQVYASGLRNSYDFVWHSNGSLYATDNGLGVTGTIPPSPAPNCTGLSPLTLNPGKQPDLLLKVEQGKYYGHPNPYRNQCVFKNGTFQGVTPLANYQPPLATLGENLSANGIIEYTANNFFGQLKGQLLIANFSLGDNITRIKLSPDGLSVVESATLASQFTEPLPLETDAQGNIYVGEFNGNKVTVLVPLGAWITKQPVPNAILDAGGAAVDGKLYMVGGKTATTYISTLYIYNPATDSWTSGPNLPGPAVENPAVVEYNGKLYIFGGSTQPFSGAVTNSAVFDPTTSTWTSIAPMTTGRGGATAGVLNDHIYVVGGLDAGGASLASVEVYNIATNTWNTATPMATPRDNPGSAVVAGKLYIFGGRTREANGTTVNGTLATVEIYDPTTNSWSAGAQMPTGRRAMSVGTLNNRIQVIGGEITNTGGVFSQNEEYNPTTNSWRTLTPAKTPRHGAATATINNVIYIAGGHAGGSSLSNVTEGFAF
ncbi:Kelch repeat-containing protein [Anabaena azotica]|uniref:PQQ-dependent sugar dehydrogenase n=1 Tax=Anabaena azotica FACHB-119 TaxID=947527 RepID=A0ABR8D6T2_9NOST|nr:kelch repeat-containing protein [Anabaena azotica]MBD2502153.1 PQQ-dependent sugar dehydrogenase [Anabaena azotica FACHB-119]